MLAALPLPLRAQLIAIRSWDGRDASTYFDLAHDPEIIRYLGSAPKFVEQAAECLSAYIRATDAGELYRLAVCREDSTPVGLISLQHMKSDDPRLELVIGIGSVYRGVGYDKLATKTLIGATFEANPDVTEIYGRREWGNSASRGVMRAVGMRSTGLEPSTKLNASCPDRLYVVTRSARRDV